jgi:5-dehydro-2-deoxygluconokinase
VRGIVVLGLDAPQAELEESFAVAARHFLVKGFAVGRTIFASSAAKWLAGEITDGEAVAQMADNYAGLCAAWEKARSGGRKIA